MANEETPFKFDATGTFLIEKKFEQELSCIGETVGFKLPDGRTVKICIALEVEDADGKSFEYITNESDMNALGFRCLDYDDLKFSRISS